VCTKNLTRLSTKEGTRPPKFVVSTGAKRQKRPDAKRKSDLSPNISTKLGVSAASAKIGRQTTAKSSRKNSRQQREPHPSRELPQLSAKEEDSFFSFEVCNNSSELVSIAVVGRLALHSNDWTVKGWWSASPGATIQIGKFVKGNFYATGRGEKGARWSQEDFTAYVDISAAFARIQGPSYAPGLSLPKTRFVRTGDAIRPRLHGRRCFRRARSGAGLAHPFRAKHEDATHYNRRRISQGSAAGALR